MQQAKKITGLPTTVEVATGKQVEDALTFDVDVLWVGATEIKGVPERIIKLHERKKRAK